VNGSPKIGWDLKTRFGMAAKETIMDLIGFANLGKLGIGTGIPASFAGSMSIILGALWTFIIFNHLDFLD
jgi:hypothetical protein